MHWEHQGAKCDAGAWFRAEKERERDSQCVVKKKTVQFWKNEKKMRKEIIALFFAFVFFWRNTLVREPQPSLMVAEKVI